MHILYYHQYFISREGAGGTRSYENALALVKAGHNVTMVCGHSKSGLISKYKKGIRFGKIDGINVIQFDTQYSNTQSFMRRSISFFTFIIRSSRLIFTLNYDIIVTTSTPLTIGIPGIIAKVFRRKYFIFEVRDLWPELPKAMGVIKNPIILSLMSLLEYLIYKSADRLIGLSGGMVNGISKRGISENRIMLIPNGCDNDLFSAEEKYKRAAPMLDDDFIVIFSGAHGLANGLDAVLDTAVYLKSLEENNIKFLFVGEGNCKSDLIRRSETEELNNCIFLPSVSKNKIVKILKNADIGLQVLKDIPEFYNGTSPNKFYDYISAGLPVITNYPGEIAELIIKNNIGKVVDSDNPEDFANALLELRNNPEMRYKMKTNALELALDKFDRKKLVNKWVKWVTEGLSV